MTEGPDIPFEEAEPRRCPYCGAELTFFRYTGNAVVYGCRIHRGYTVGVLL